VIGPLRRPLAALLAAVPLAMVAVTVADVVGRRFDRPLPGAIEIIELLMGVLVFGALPGVTAERGHVTVGLFDERLGAAARRVRDRFVALLSAAVLATIAWRLAAKTMELAGFGDRSTYLGVPLAPLAGFMALMTAVAVVELLRQAWAPGPRGTVP
jgi:TRAP-type C4-dicarboxylate transport system permease small subunit